jgi:hypothetical protein
MQATNVPAEQLRLWAEQTRGMSVASFYRYRAEALNDGAG